MHYYDFSHNMIIRTLEKNSTKDGAYVRFVHAATKSTDTDLYINDILVVPDLKYREFTDYVKLPVGTYNIKVYPKNTRKIPLIDSNLSLTSNTLTTYALCSHEKCHSLHPVCEEPLSVPTKKKAKIRIANLIKNILPIDIYLSDGTLLYKNVTFKDTTKYIELPPNTYVLDIKLADSDISTLYAPNVNFNSNNYYTLYLIGLINDYHDPQMLVPLDGITYM